MQNRPYKNLDLSHTSLRFAPDVVFITDQNGHIIFSNDYAPEVTGYSTPELLGMTVFDLAPADWHASYRDKMGQIVADGQRHVMEIRLVTKAGVKIPMELSVVMMPNGQLYGTCRDISERKLAAAKISESNKNFATLIETIPDAIIFKDGEGRWISANEPALQLFHLKDQAWQGKTNAELLHVKSALNEVQQNCSISDELTWQSRELSHFNEQ